MVNKQLGFATVIGFFAIGSPQLNGQTMDPAGRPRISVVVCDKARVKPEAMLIAKNEAARILRSAEVDITWIDSVDASKRPTKFDLNSLEGCELPTIDHDFMVVIAEELPKGRNPDVMGLASQNGNYPRAYVLYKRVRSYVDNHGMRDSVISNEGIILGHVIAHELGHLLMPGQPHSVGGIMRAQWSDRDWHDAIQGGFLFHLNEAKLIQQLRSQQLQVAAGN